MKKQQNSLLLALRLTAVVAVTTLLLAVVNAVTAPVIAERVRREGMQAREALIPGSAALLSSPELSEAEAKTVGDIYRITRDDAVQGYCVDISVNGFGGTISMIVAVSVDRNILGVKILSHSETPGIGSKAVEEDGALLAALKDIPVRGVHSVEGISGATVSSKAILSGVLTATQVVERLEQERGGA